MEWREGELGEGLSGANKIFYHVLLDTSYIRFSHTDKQELFKFGQVVKQKTRKICLVN